MGVGEEQLTVWISRLVSCEDSRFTHDTYDEHYENSARFVLRKIRELDGDKKYNLLLFMPFPRKNPVMDCAPWRGRRIPGVGNLHLYIEKSR